MHLHRGRVAALGALADALRRGPRGAPSCAVRGSLPAVPSTTPSSRGRPPWPPAASCPGADARQGLVALALNSSHQPGGGGGAGVPHRHLRAAAGTARPRAGRHRAPGQRVRLARQPRVDGDPRRRAPAAPPPLHRCSARTSSRPAPSPSACPLVLVLLAALVSVGLGPRAHDRAGRPRPRVHRRRDARPRSPSWPPPSAWRPAPSASAGTSTT